MKTRQLPLFVAALLAGLPAATFAQASVAPLTRTQVREELVAIEHAGYWPNRSSPEYPADIQAAEARERAMKTAAPAPQADVGGVPGGSLASGERVVAGVDIGRSLFAHH